MQHKSHDIVGQSPDITGFIICFRIIQSSHDIMESGAKKFKKNVAKIKMTLFEFLL